MVEGSISYTLVRRVAAEKGVDPTSLRPLYEVIDTDALDALFEESSTARLRDGYVGFSYEGYAVRIGHDGSVSLAPASE